MTDIDFINRDPNNLNSHLNANFEDIIAEPDGTHSSECTWSCAYKCFNCWKGFCYNFSTFFCGCCLAAYWGCEFASIIFTQVWWTTPSLRKLAMNCAPMQKIWAIYTQCCIAPICDACGMLFANIKITKA